MGSFPRGSPSSSSAPPPQQQVTGPPEPEMNVPGQQSKGKGEELWFSCTERSLSSQQVYQDMSLSLLSYVHRFSSSYPLADFASMPQPPQPQQPHHLYPNQGPPLPGSAPYPHTMGTTVNLAEHTRRQNVARHKAGLPPIAPNDPNYPNPNATQPPAAALDARHEAARRVALGLDTRPTKQQQTQPQYPSSGAPAPMQYKPLIQNGSSQTQQYQKTQTAKQTKTAAVASANNAINAQTQQVLPENKATARPTWSEARLAGDVAKKDAATTEIKYGDPSIAPVLGEKLQSLCKSIDPSYVLDSEVQERLVELADSFVDKVTKDALRLAKHRGSSCLDVVDVSLALKKGYGLSVPGLGPPSVAADGAPKSSVLGGWMFAGKVNAGVDGDDEPDAKKRKIVGNAAAANM